MARKPLIPAGSYLTGRDESAAPPSGLMANVIARDRERNGRSAPASTPASVPEPPPEEAAVIPDEPAATEEVVEEAPPPAPVAVTPVRTEPMERTITTEKPAAKPAKRAPAAAAAPAVDPKAAAWRVARRRAASNSLPITLRAPEDLNDYLDQLAYELRKHKVKKQELVSLAIQLLYVEAETGADILDLLGRKRGRDFDEDDEG